MAARLDIARIETEAELLGRAEHAHAVERRLDELARVQLPRRLAGLLAPRLVETGEIVRIERLEVEIDLDLAELMGPAGAAVWARELGAALDAALAHPGAAPQVRFATAADYAAAYLEHRFGEVRHPAWAFEEFAALDLLSAGEAAVELAAAMPSVVAALARRSARHDRADLLSRRLAAREAARLVRRLAATSVDRATIDGLLDAFARGPTAPAVPPEASSAHVLALAAAVLARGAAGAPVADVLAVARIVAALDVLVAADPRLGTGAAAPDAGDLVTVMDQLPGTRRSAVAEVLAPWLHADDRATLLTWAARRRGTAGTSEPSPSEETATRARAARAEAAAPKPTRAEDEAGAAPLVAASHVAGLALVVPIVRDLGLWRALSPAALRALLLALAPVDPGDPTRADAFVAQLAPVDVDAPAPVWPALPPHALRGLDDERAAAIAGAAGAEAWALLVATRFAERLPGLAGSSLGYLRRQFFRRFGVLHADDERLDVTLAPVPLAVVLQMAGMAGARGPIPWLGDRTLTIRLENG